MKCVVLVIFLYFSGVNFALCDDEIQKFVSLKGRQVNLRNGPGDEYKIIRVYDKTKMPLAILHRVDNWYMVSDYKENIGWVRVNLANSSIKSRTVIFKTQQDLCRFPSRDNCVKIGRANKDEVGILHKCNGRFCRIKFVEKNISGWVDQRQIWGVLKDEIL